MGSRKRNITFCQGGLLRIDIVAIIMVLTALVIVLTMNVIPKPQAEVHQGTESVPVLLPVSAHAGTLAAPQLKPAAGPESDLQ